MTAAIEDSALVQVTASPTAISFTAAVANDVLVLLMVSVVDKTITAVSVNGTPRNAIMVDVAAGTTYADLAVVPLDDGDANAQVQVSSVPGWTVLAWAVVSGTPMIPTDWVLYYETRNAGQTLRTQPWVSEDIGIYLAAGVIAGEQEIPVQPTGWTELALYTGPLGTVHWVTGPISAAGYQAHVQWDSGEVPTGATGEVYWVAPYDVGLRIRDAGAWADAGAVWINGDGGAPEPPAMPFPQLSPLPALPDDGPGVVVPTPPWIPGTGPYRSSEA